MASTASDSPSSKPAAQSYSTDPALYIYTSLTAGSSHIVTATSRLETILRANRVPFKAVDVATDDKARMLWGRRAGKDEGGRPRKLPGLVQMGLVLGDLVEIEDWNEYGELKQHVTIYYDEFTQPPISQAPPPPKTANPTAKPSTLAASSSAPGSGSTPNPPPPAPPMPEEKETTTATGGGDGADDDGKKEEKGGVGAAVARVALPIRSIAEEAAAKAKQVRLQSLREKVYGKGGKEDTSTGEGDKTAAANVEGSEEEEEDDDKTPAPLTPVKSAKAAPGMQSPTTGTWRDGASFSSSSSSTGGGDGQRATNATLLQSPTTTSWRVVPMPTPADVDAPITSYRGSLVASASEEEIAAVERAEAIVEEEEPEDEEESSREDESQGGGDGEEKKK